VGARGQLDSIRRTFNSLPALLESGVGVGLDGRVTHAGGVTMSTPELFQFRVSHFNEKARWALDYKSIEHVRHSLVPGAHKPKIKKLSGQEQVPVLCMNGKVVAGSRG
jgi:hypothetical protein